MVKILAAIVALLPTTLLANVCHRCKFHNMGKHYPAFSKQLQECISSTAKRLKISISDSERKYINLLISREEPEGDIAYRHEHHHGLGQGTRETYRAVGIPWGIECASCEVEMMIKYVHNRYRTFNTAWRHWNRHVNGHKRRWY